MLTLLDTVTGPPENGGTVTLLNARAMQLPVGVPANGGPEMFAVVTCPEGANVIWTRAVPLGSPGCLHPLAAPTPPPSAAEAALLSNSPPPPVGGGFAVGVAVAVAVTAEVDVEIGAVPAMGLVPTWVGLVAVEVASVEATLVGAVSVGASVAVEVGASPIFALAVATAVAVAVAVGVVVGGVSEPLRAK